MYKNLENIFKHPSPDTNVSTSPSGGEVLNSVFNASSFSVIRRRYSLREVPWRGIHNVIAAAVAFSNKVMDTPELPLPIKRHEAPKYDICSVGRSMIEMLGVLAIIAVLSVGGIAGYSKAMEKYKLNKWKEDLVMLISNLNTTYINSKNYTETHEKNLTDFFEELKIIPENMLDEQNNDIFGNNLQISSHIPSRAEFGSRLFLYFWTLPNHSSVEECKTLFDIALQYEGVWATVLNEAISGKIGGIYAICGKSAPTSYAEWIRCQPYNIGEIAQNYNICAQQNCDINLIISNGI